MMNKEDFSSRKASSALKGSAHMSEQLLAIARMDNTRVLSFLQTDMEGLAAEAVESTRERYGLNEVAHEKPPTWYMQLGEAFINPFIGVLVFLGCVSLVTDVIMAAPGDRSYKTIIVLSAMVGISVILRFWQEFRSAQAAEQLKTMVRTTAAVLRKGRPIEEIPVAELVPGDIVQLAAGDMIPADLRCLGSKDLFISQAVLTGESVPVEKYDTLPDHANALDAQTASPLEMRNLCLMGTNVVSGTGMAVVVATGNNTYFGTMARNLVGKRPLTSFDRGINKVSWVLIRFMAVMVPVVFLINGFTKHNWLDALLFSVSVAVGLTPEMLPMIVSTNLAKGAVVMAKRKTIVKRLNSIQNFGAMDILCTDKTGTLTQDKIILERHLDIYGNEDSQVLKFAYLNSFYQTGLRNLLDKAVIQYGEENGLKTFGKDYHKIDEIPFDFIRRRMSVIVRTEDGRNLLICKGAPGEISAICSQVDENGMAGGGIVPYSDILHDRVSKTVRDLNEDGLRVLAVAYKWLPAENRTYTVNDETDMTLAGYMAFLDPPKESAKRAIPALWQHGVAVKVITGDNEIVTQKICKEVGLKIEGLLLGSDVDGMTDEVLAGRAENTTIFARMAPLQKARVIRALQSRGHTVGYLGDGINDAPSLRDADVGISVDTAVDIAKESADIILLEKSLMVLEDGVVEGRRTFGNIIKYINMTASSNFGNVFSVLIASAFLPFLPMMAIQLLIQNLLYDISQISIPWDSVDPEYLEKPRKWEAGHIARFMIFLGPTSSIFDVTTFCLMWFVFKANNPDVQSLFQSGWFIEGLLSQTLIVHMIRTQKIPFFQSMPSMPVLLLTLVIMAIGIALPFVPLGARVGLVPLPMSYFSYLALTLFGYCTLTQLVKFWYIRRFGQWL